MLGGSWKHAACGRTRFVHCTRARCSPGLGWGRWYPMKSASAKLRSAIGLPNSRTPTVLAPCWPWLRSSGASWRKKQPNDKSPLGHLWRKRYVRLAAGATRVVGTLAGADPADNGGRHFSPCPLVIAAPGRDLSIAAHVDDSIEIRAMTSHAIFGKILGLMLGTRMRDAAG